MIEEDKVTLARTRAELIDHLATPLSAETRVRLQGELSVINAKIKAINTTQAAQLKAAADRRKVAGLAEAQANATRAITKARGDAGEPAPVDAWIDTVLLRGEVHFERDPAGKRTIVPSAQNKEAWAYAVQLLIDGLHAVAHGRPLPDLTPVPAFVRVQKTSSKKPKSR